MIAARRSIVAWPDHLSKFGKVISCTKANAALKPS
jgi:hypothetical protein